MRKIIMSFLVIIVLLAIGGCGSLFQGALPQVKIEYEPPDIVTADGIVVDQGKISYQRSGEQAIAGLDVQLNKDTKIKLDQAENKAADEAIKYMAPYMQSVTEFMTEIVKKLPAIASP